MVVLPNLLTAFKKLMYRKFVKCLSVVAVVEMILV